MEGKSQLERIREELLFLIEKSEKGRIGGTAQEICVLFRKDLFPEFFLNGRALVSAIGKALNAHYVVSRTRRKPRFLDVMIVADREERLGEYVYFLSVARKEGGGREV